MRLLLFLLFPIFSAAQTRITNATYIDPATGQITKGKTILVKAGGKARSINAKGAYVMPALFDMHVHAPDTLEAAFFGLLYRAGIQQARIMKTSAAQAAKLDRLAGRVRLDIGYNIYSTNTTPPDSIAALVAGLRPQGYDFIKCFSVPRRGWFDTLMLAAKARGITVCGHSLANVPPLHALQSGYKSIEHLGYFDKASPAGLDSLLQQAKVSGTYLCPTLDWSMMVYHTVPKDSALLRAGTAEGLQIYKAIWERNYAETELEIKANKARYDAYFHEQLAVKLNVLRKAHALGIPILAGSDAEEPYQTPGYSLVEELKWIRQAGFTNLELLQMVTINPLRYYGQKQSSAYIILPNNPLENIGHLATVQQLVM